MQNDPSCPTCSKGARDQLVDPLAEGLDVVIRIGRLGDTTLIARRLGAARILHCASPAYLRRRGHPASPAELADHDCIGYLREGRPDPFSFEAADGTTEVPIAGHVHANDGDILRTLALAGRGIIAIFDFLVHDDLRGLCSDSKELTRARPASRRARGATDENAALPRDRRGIQRPGCNLGPP
jgi:DNA-binding transcriptional LysR family regulator